MVKSTARARCGSEVVRSMVLQVMRISGWCMLDPDIADRLENVMVRRGARDLYARQLDCTP